MYFTFLDHMYIKQIKSAITEPEFQYLYHRVVRKTIRNYQKNKRQITNDTSLILGEI